VAIEAEKLVTEDSVRERFLCPHYLVQQGIRTSRVGKYHVQFVRNIWGFGQSSLGERHRWEILRKPKLNKRRMKNMKTMKIATAISTAGLLALGTAVWAADQSVATNHDQTPAFRQTPNHGYYDPGYEHYGYFGCYYGGPASRAHTRAEDTSGTQPQGFWHRCCHWFGRMNPWHHANSMRSAYRGCCR
jgi:hypothetical protein